MDIKKMKEKKDIEELIINNYRNALKDENSTVRKQAVEALGKIGDKRAKELLIEALKDKDKSVRKKAKVALEKKGDREAKEPLTEALKELQQVKENVIAKIKCPNCNGSDINTETVTIEHKYRKTGKLIGGIFLILIGLGFMFW